MQPVPALNRTITEIVKGPALDVTQQLELRPLMNLLTKLREWPDIAMIVQLGIVEPPHQRLMLRLAHRGAPNNVIVASRGTSKCLEVGTMVIMADGSRRAVELVAVGDAVLGPDSQPKRVLATAVGVGELYRVKQTSAMAYTVNAEHVLSLRKSTLAAASKSGAFTKWEGTNAHLPIAEWQQATPYVQSHLRGYKVPLHFEAQATPLDPYFFGVWCGDGSGNNRVVAITTADAEITQACYALAAQHGAEVRVHRKPKNKASTLRLVTNGTRAKPNPLLTRIRDMGVMSEYGEGSQNKHIPQCYQTNSEAVRLELLAGLLDSDGNKDHNGYAFTNTNHTLIRDVKRLADSLGFRTSMYQIKTACVNYTGTAWRLSINGDVWRVPCRIPRKQYRAEDLRKNKDWRLSQVTVEAVGPGPWAGFECEGGLFLLDDGTVTHNSTTVGLQYPVYRLMHYAGMKAILLSATGFRGGQTLFNDLSRLVAGGWDSQDPALKFVKRASKNPKVIHRAQNFWAWPLDNHAEYKTLPTNDPDKIRGERANLLNLDEANFLNPDIIEKVAKPFLNVLGDFRHGGAFAVSNQVFYTTTVDYAWRPFSRVYTAARESLTADYQAVQNQRRGRHAEYNERAREGFNSYTCVVFDYTDLFVRETAITRSGHQYRVKYPDKHLPKAVRPFGIPYTTRNAKGELELKTEKVTGWMTYPIDFKIVEGGLVDGSTPLASWASEQRNVVDTAVGNVFSATTLDAVVQLGDRCVIPFAGCSKDWQLFHDEEQADFCAPLLWTCTDPCVIGVDYAGGNRDFAAFTVIRIGPMASGEFNPLTGHGKTRWSNVVWAEQHRLMSHEDAAIKIRTLLERYNVVYYYTPGDEDDWRVARGVGLDMRGGGVGVRDQLVYINEQYVPENRFRIYDPLDVDPRILAYSGDRNAKPMLDTISPTDTLNDRLVTYLDGQFEAGLLYLPKWIPEVQRPERLKSQLAPGYATVRILEMQLRKIQQEPTKNARTFYMAGNNESERNKKDVFSSLLYAAKQLRAHLIRKTMIDATGAETSGRRTVPGSGKQKRPLGRVPGGKM